MNLSSVGDTGLGSGFAPSFVDVPADTTTQQFTVSCTSTTLIVAQPERNIAISVITGDGYTASTDSTTVSS